MQSQTMTRSTPAPSCRPSWVDNEEMEFSSQSSSSVSMLPFSFGTEWEGFFLGFGLLVLVTGKLSAMFCFKSLRT